MPDKTLPFTSLPPMSKPTLGDERDKPKQVAQATAQYWEAVAKVQGAYEVECQKVRIKSGFFKVRRVAPADARREHNVGLADEQFGKTEKERARRISDMAAQAGLDWEEAVQMTFHELRTAVASKKASDKQDRMRLAEARAQGPFAHQNEMLRQLDGKKTQKQLQDSDETFNTLASSAATAAASLDAIPIGRADRSVIEFAIELAAAYRRLALSTNQARVAIKLLAKGGSPAEAEMAIAQMKRDRAALDEVRNIGGGELRVRLKAAYDRDFAPTAMLPPDELHLFDGVEVEPK